MAGKLAYMQFYPGDWLKDPALRRCTHAAKGVYIDMLCFMWECEERGVLATSGQAWGDEEIARAVGGDQRETLALIAELVAKGVVSRRASGAIYSRRMVRDEEERRKTAARVRNHRASNGCNADVTPDVTLMKRSCTVSDVDIDIDSKGSIHPPDIPVGNSERKIAADALELYGLYPRKVGKAVAIKAIRKALVAVGVDELREAVAAYAQARAGEDPDFTPHPATWFNGRRWEDDRSTWKRSSVRQPTVGQPGFFAGLQQLVSEGEQNGAA